MQSRIVWHPPEAGGEGCRAFVNRRGRPMGAAVNGGSVPRRRARPGDALAVGGARSSSHSASRRRPLLAMFHASAHLRLDPSG